MWPPDGVAQIVTIWSSFTRSPNRKLIEYVLQFFLFSHQNLLHYNKLVEINVQNHFEIKITHVIWVASFQAARFAGGGKIGVL